jgi:hypothetical protein
VKQEFDRLYGLFIDFLRNIGQEDFAIEAAELTYINLAEAGEYWHGVDDIATVIPSFRPTAIGIPGSQLEGTVQSDVWKIANDLSLSTKVQTARLRADQHLALIFELSAKGRLGAATKAEADLWFDRAYEITGRAFLGMTSPDIQARVWQPQ